MVSFNAHKNGIEIVDSIERRRLRLAVPESAGSVEPTPVSPDRFSFPVDAAVEVAAGAIVVEGVAEGYVRREDGEMVAAVGSDASTELPADRYEVEVNVPVKLYLRGEGEFAATVDGDRTRFSFGGETVLVGARSYHERPAATVTTSTDPEDALRALSYLGSALKTTSPERSYPTLRGHPPRLEVGEEFAVPDSLSKPETGVELVVPPTHRAAVVAAPLAFYLGADVRPGEDPRLLADGFEFPLDERSVPESFARSTAVTADGDGFSLAVERALRQSFFLDCLVRTEGYYRVALHEREAVESELALDFAALYDRPLAARLETYLSVPFEAVADHLPRWNVAAFVEPTAAGLEALPYVVGDLAVVRPAEGEPVSPEAVRAAVLDDFLDRPGTRGGGDRHRTRAGGGADDEEDRENPDAENPPLPRMVRPPETDAVEVAWFGDGVPMDASKATTTAFENWFDRDSVDGDIDIVVVCNDESMRVEDDVVSDVYGSREDLPFDVSVRRDLTTAELRETLTAGADFLHYVGHIDADGFACADGSLDATTLDVVDVDAFLLNACRSYEQGMALVEAGSVGGVVTFSEVVDSGAVRVGATMARLLDRGFPLRPALEIAREESFVGGHYTVVGDGRVSVVQAEGGLSMLCELVSEEADSSASSDAAADVRDVTFYTYPPREGGLGTLARPTVAEMDRYYLTPGTIGPLRARVDELREYLARNRYPIKEDGALRWCSDVLDR
ncbi:MULTISPECIES: hypothetical protein [Halorussus]|uniref:hypothetical protein n=1 Tax=Halorussus TaxID=1070314 RepID=UPI0020A01E56|nr:hypothetical protein [Halorussus vallis]USZ76624.1 hypothetical protein NGM07_04680 [Halorussus vallis]